MFNNLNILFSLMIFSSSLISISATNWFGAWMGLELNMISFIPFIGNNKNILSNECALKYFLIQAIASASFLTFCLFNSILSSTLTNMNLSILNLFMSSTLMLKLGAAPFQSWFVSITEGLSWSKCFILMTWQKLAPLFLTFYIMNHPLISLCCILSILIGAIFALNQTSLKKILAYSSINHLGWLLSSMMMSKMFFAFYFLSYSFMNMFTLLNFSYLNLLNLSQMYTKNSIHISISLLSLSGLPPFFGFLPKWLIINALLNLSMHTMCLIMIMASLITSFFYLRMIFKSFIMIGYTQKWNLNSSNKFSFTNNFFLLFSCTSLMFFNMFI